MQVKFERIDFLTNMMKFHRKIWDSTERVIKIILTRKLWRNLLQYHFQPKMTKVELVHKVKGKDMNNQIYSYLFISESKHDPHNNILARKTVCIIRKYVDLRSATSDYFCML